LLLISHLLLSAYIISLVVILSSICLVIHPSKFLIPEEEDDGRGGQMAASAVYPNVYVIQSCSL
jgi:hypothetical protein